MTNDVRMTTQVQPCRRRHPRIATAALAVGALLLTGCGTRLSSSAAADQLAALPNGAGQTVDGGTTGGGSATSGGGTGSASGGGTSGSSSGGSTGGGSSGGSLGSTGSTGGTSGGPAAGATTGGGKLGGTSGSSRTSSSGDGTTAAASKAPVVIGMVGNFAGVIGSSSAPSRDAAAAWVKTTNAKGGIDGHPIKLLIADDGNSATNDIANVRRLIEDEHAIGILNFYPAAGGADPVGQYARDRKIAIVGGSGYEAAWNQYPGMFPVSTGDVPQDRAWADAMKQAGVKKVGSIHCSEAAVCADKQKVWAAAAKQAGLDVVYEGQVSLAQPDFTSACVSARSNGAEAVVTIVDGASTLRYARDCDRQGYKHLIIVPNPGNDTPPYLEGAIAPIASFPWFLTSGSPALSEYAAAMKQFVPTINTFSAQGWTAGKLMEKALTGHLSAKPQPSDLLNGLYGLRNETLGGLSQPLNFAPGKSAPVIPCAWKVVVQNGHWTAPSGLKATYCS